MAKFCLKKQSKRQPARLRYKIEKKVRQHNKKLRRTKKNGTAKSNKVIQVPNICPFKEDILKEVDALKKQKEEEKKRLKEVAAQERKKKDSNKSQSLSTLVNDVNNRIEIHELLKPKQVNQDKTAKETETSLKTYYKEFKKVVDAADVILEVVDARDPLGSKCNEVEQAVLQGNKKLVCVLNKADLIPRDVLDQWLKYLRRTTPAIPFKSSTQNQSKKLGQRRFAAAKSDKVLQNSISVGADLLMSLLGNYCRNNGVKTSITVGVVGLPNVGKSSLINSLKRAKTCNVGSTPGVTKSMQEIQLDSKIKLLDSPGVVFSKTENSSACLRNILRVSALSDPLTPAIEVLQRVPKQNIMELYDVTDYRTPQEFFSLKASRMGRFRKGGIPNMEAAARSLLDDWNNGKIRYYTLPPEDTTNAHVSSSIVSKFGEEFDFDKLVPMETDILDQLTQGQSGNSGFMLTSVDSNLMDTTNKAEENNIKVAPTEIKKRKIVKLSKKTKPDPEMELEGNLRLNRVKKMQFKKEKKMNRRKEKVLKLSTVGLDEEPEDVPM